MKDNRTEYALLGLLTLGPMSGYDLKQISAESIGAFWQESYGQIYPALRRLEGRGLVRSRAEGGARARRVYSVTAAGANALGRWLALPIRPQPWRFELLLKLFFGSRVPVEVNRAHVRAFRDRHAALLEGYEARERGIAKQYPHHPGLPFWRITLRFGRHQSGAMVAWADETLAALARRKPKTRPMVVGGKDRR